MRIRLWATLLLGVMSRGQSAGVRADAEPSPAPAGQLSAIDLAITYSTARAQRHSQWRRRLLAPGRKRRCRINFLSWFGSGRELHR